jgi:polysaccharide export outer membrane protein
MTLLLWMITTLGVLVMAGCALWTPPPPLTVTDVKAQPVPSPEAPVAAAAARPAEPPTPPIESTTPPSAAPAGTAPAREIVVPRPPIESGPIGTPQRLISAPPQSGDYRIGQDDELAISVYNETDLTKTQIVRPGGNISFPLAGEVAAGGRTPEELALVIEQRLASYVRNPRVTVIVTRYDSRRVNVLGELREPGVVRFASDITLLDAVSRASGLTEDADLVNGVLLRDGEVQPVDLYRLFRRADTSQNVVMKPGDTVLIPSVKDRKVMVLGQVNKSLIVPVTPGLNVTEALSRASGLTDDADLMGSMLIRDRQVQPVDFYKLIREGDFTQNVSLQDGDTILIANIRETKVFVLGQVAKPNVVPVTPHLTLVEAIARAGGITDNADLPGSLLIRNGQAQPVNYERLLRKGDASQNVVMQANDVVLIPNVTDRKVFVLGEVARPQTLALRTGTTLVEALASAGGLTLNAKRSNVLVIRGGLGEPRILAVNVDTVTNEGQVAANVNLEPGDIVYAPRTLIADVVKYFQDLNTILTPFITAMSGIVLGPAVAAVLTGHGQAVTTSINVSP